MNEPSMLQVVLMGLITVFVVLICLIVIIKILGLVMEKVSGKNAPQAAPAPAAAAPAQGRTVSGGGQQLVAAIAAAIAEDMGEEVDHIRIHSIRRI